MNSSVAKPIIKQIKDTREALDFFEQVSLLEEDEETQEIIMNFPTVYIHNWRESGNYEVYVGESNDIFKRTRQHYDEASDKSKWKSKGNAVLVECVAVFFHGKFNFKRNEGLLESDFFQKRFIDFNRIKGCITQESLCYRK